MTTSHLSIFTIKQLKQFLWVADLGSYTAAAAQTFRTQSALSLSVKQMEERLGQTLFEPAARTTLTPFGEQCAFLARTLIEHHERVSTAMLHLAQGRSGKLSIACVGAALHALLSRLLPRFSAAYPDVGISILDYHSLNVERAVLSYEADFGLGSRISLDDRLTFTPLFSDVFGVVCTKDHPFSVRKSIAWSELEGSCMIGSPAHDLLLERPEASVLRTCKHQASHMVPTIAMLEYGLGITVLGSFAIPPDKRNLCYVPLNEPIIKFDLGLTKLSNRTLPPPAALMERIILNEYL